jgi:hypothetical protein
MSEPSPNFIRGRIEDGIPMAASGAARAIENIHEAITRLQVQGDNKIDARIDWVAGIPKITIRWKGE